MYSVHEQYVDVASGFHVIELRDARGNRHVLQLAVGAAMCAACGHVHPRDGLEALDAKRAIAEACAGLQAQQERVLAYAARHGVAVRP